MNKLTLCALACVLALSSRAQAGDRCSGCDSARMKKVCRVVCELRDEKKTVYSCECEDFCVPGPSQKCGEKWVCDADGHRRRETIWKPGCADVRTKAKLVKREVTRKVPVYKWEVVEVCSKCGDCCQDAATAGDEGLANEELAEQERADVWADSQAEQVEGQVADQRIQTPARKSALFQSFFK